MTKLQNGLYLIRYAWTKVRSYFFTTAAKGLFSALLPLIDIAGLGIVVDALTTGAAREEVLRVILVYLGVNLAVTLAQILLTYLDNVVMRHASNVSQTDYMYDCVYINYHYVEDGSILNLKKKSMGAQPAWFVGDLGRLFEHLLRFAGVVYLFAVLTPWFLVLLLTTSAVMIFLDLKQQKMDFEFSNAQTEDDRRLEYLYSTMSDYRFAKEIRINRADGFLSGKYARILTGQIKKLRKYARRVLGMNLLSAAMNVVQSAVMYVYFTRQVFDGVLTVAEYTVMLGATPLLTVVLFDLFRCFGRINKTLNHAGLFREYREKVRENSDISLDAPETSPGIDWENAEITFSHVTFSYPGSDRVIIDDVSFTIKPGEKIGIVGLNGSGKTTLIKLLCRLYDPTSGTITVGGADIRTIPHGEYARRIGIVLQDYALFAYSVRENIVFDGEPDDVRMNAAIEKSGLSKKIATLPKGTDTVLYKALDPDGVEFSGGEGQKLALARAVYKNAGFFILDEPTSTLDPIAEYDLFSRLSAISGGKTTLFISHRLSSTKFCDRILVLDGGRVTETGSHDELMSLGGLYADLFRAQAKYYEMEGTDA